MKTKLKEYDLTIKARVATFNPKEIDIKDMKNRLCSEFLDFYMDRGSVVNESEVSITLSGEIK